MNYIEIGSVIILGLAVACVLPLSLAAGLWGMRQALVELETLLRTIKTWRV